MAIMVVTMADIMVCGYYGGGIYAGGGGGGYYNSHDYNNSVYYGPLVVCGSTNGPTQSEKTANAQRYGCSWWWRWWDFHKLL